MINIAIGTDGKPSVNNINIGNQWENLDETINFSFPEEFKDYNKYIVAYIKDKKTKEEITRIFPITNNRFIVSSGITKVSGSWHLYTICKTSPVDLDGDTIDLRAQEGEHISISDAIIATISSSDISSDTFQNFPIDENIKIIYDELIAFKLELEKADAVREENEIARKHEETLRATAEEKRNLAEKTRESNEATRKVQESSRVSAEEQRASIEDERKANETQRKANEQSRIDAEKRRESNTSTAIKNIETTIKSVNDKTNSFNASYEEKVNNFNQDYTNKINTFNSSYSQKVKEFNDSYSTKTQAFNDNYNTKTASLNTKLDKFEADTDKIVSDSITQFTKDIQAQGEKTLASIPEDYRTLNAKVQTTYENGQSYQDQINKLQKSEALQDEVLDKLNEEVDLKLTQPYLNNNDSTHITSSDNGSLKNIVVKGNTVQNSTKGLNLINCTPKTTTINGITMVNNGDGTYTVNGTATDEFDIALAPYTTKQNIYYTLSGCPSGGSKTTYYLDPRGYEYDTGRGTTIINPNQDFSNYIRIVIKKDVTVKNLLFKPMFNEGQTAQPFEPYTGGQPSPSPDYPQEVKGVSEISGKVVGKNLFDVNKIKEISNSIKRNDDGSLTITSTSADSSVATKMALKDLADLEIGKTYIISFITTGKNQIYLNEVKQYWGSNKALTITQDMLNSNVRLYPKDVNSTDIVSGIQIEEASTATDYQPYQSQSFNYTLSKPLYRLSDSVYDYLDIDKGKIIRNVGVATFDGSDDEEISKVSNINTNVYQFSRAINSIEKYAKYAKCDSFQIATAYANDLLRNDNKIYAATISCYLSFDKMNTVEKLKVYLQQNPITVYYQLATPTEEPLPSDLQTLLQSLKTYYPQTNIIWNTEVEPYINFDYKLNLKSWIEDKDNKEIIYDKQNKEKDKYSSTFFENMFALQRTGEVYTVKFPKWETSHISTGEKLDANAGLICEPSTKTIKGQNDYANIPLFKTYDVNAYVDDDGVRHVTAIKGDKDFKDEGKVDVFVLGMSYYEKVWEDDQYWYYSRTDMPRDGYTIARECINRDGSIQPFALYAKYVSGDINGVLYSSKGLQPARTCYSGSQLNNGITYHDNSYNNLIKEGQKKGKFYSAGMICDYKYILTTFYLKYATLNSQSVMTGCVNYVYQYNASIQSEEKHTYFPVTKARADVIEVNSYASVGYSSTNKSLDRSYNQLHRYGDSVKVLRKEAIDDNNVAIYLDVKEPFNTMPVTVADGVESEIYITSMHWKSGFSDDVLDRDGCPCDTKTQVINSKFPMVIQGIECMVGGYETYGNAFMDIVDATGKREVYIQNDASQLTTDIATAKTTYKKSPYAIQPTKLNSWNYITRIDFDLENGTFVQTNAGQDGSSTTTGFADGVYVDNASSGQREFLGFGYLWSGSGAGLSCLHADLGVGVAHWNILARLSINGVGGELTA